MRPHSIRRWHTRLLTRSAKLSLSSLEDRVTPAAPFPEFVDPHPVAGNQFGHSVVPLSTGNVVITSPYDDAGGVDTGAVYLFNGATGALISTLRGANDGDSIGLNGVTALSTGNFVIRSLNWDNGAAINAGAVTFGNGTTGVSGVVSTANSLVGSTSDDKVGGVLALSNGNYLVLSMNWDNGALVNAGAVTFGRGTTGTAVGAISASNSLVGTQAFDLVGWGAMPLTNGNYVVRSPYWSNGVIADVGAATFGDGTTGVVGAVSPANSFIGTTANDRVAFNLVPLTNGNYVVQSPYWRNVGAGAANAGAVSWGNGTTGLVGSASAANSLVGSKTSDSVGNYAVTALTNGNYVVVSPSWNNAGATNAGAVTWGNGTTGTVGAVSALNSLIGSSNDDFIGNGGVTALSNGNYVIGSPVWDNGFVVNAGAATWGNGTAGVSGLIGPGNSLIGSSGSDQVGDGVFPLSNGNYLVQSPQWRNGAIGQAGAVTFGNGTTGVVGVVSPANSLVGSTTSDNVGNFPPIQLSNGNYLIHTADWANGGAAYVGAVTFGSGTTGVSGVISAANSLIGNIADDGRNSSVTALMNGNYVVSNPYWDNGAIVDAGAATFGNGTTGTTGVISTANSLVSSTAFDFVGSSGVAALSNGNYVVRSPSWDNGAVLNAGAATFGSGTTGVSGAVSPANSLVGSTVNDFVGSGGLTALSNGNYAILSPFWNNGAVIDAGAMTFGSGTTGVSGTITTLNSAVGLAANTNLQPIVTDQTNATFFGRFLTEGGGRVRVGSQVDGFAPNVPPPLVVTTDADTMDGGTLVNPLGEDGLLSLREAITVSNLRAGRDSITFNIPGGGVRTISVGSTGLGVLPTITDPVTIEGFSQPETSPNTLAVGNNAVLRIVVSGPNAGSLANGFTIRANDTYIRGLSIGQFSNYGIAIESGGGNRIIGNFIGTDATGFVARGNAWGGVYVLSAHNIIGGADPADRNVISANGSVGPYGPGVYFFSPEAFDNRVFGNYIGPAADGAAGLGNVGFGVVVDGSGAFGNYIGGVNAGEGNVISWNGVGVSGGGILLIDTFGNQIRGNLIGTTATGLVSLGNDGVGVRILFGSGNTIGGATPGSRNVIADTDGDGVQLNFTTDNTIHGNTVVGNAGNGVAIYGSSNNLVAGNLISANKIDGVRFGNFNNDGQLVTSDANTIEGNLIGTNATGTAGMGNGRDGVFLSHAAHNTIANNVVAGNAHNGIGISTTDSVGNVVRGNFVGTNAAGDAAIGNGNVGVAVSAAPNTVIDGNVISGNPLGIAVLGVQGATGSTVIRNNRIGTDSTGTKALGNVVGVAVLNSAGVVIAENVISANTLGGIELLASPTYPVTDVQILGNFIGTDPSVTLDLGNGGIDPGPLVGPLNQALQGLDPTLPSLTPTQVAALEGGIVLTATTNVTVGGTAPGAANVIAFSKRSPAADLNTGDGVQVNAGTGNRISGNSIFGNQGFGIDLLNAGNVGQPAPRVYLVTPTAGSMSIRGAITATPSMTYTIEFFSNLSSDSAQGRTYLGSGMVTTDGTGHGTFTIALSVAVPSGSFVTSTATDPAGNTSMFSVIQAPQFVSADHVTFTAGTASTFTVRVTSLPWATIITSGSLPSGVTFTDNGDGTATLGGLAALGQGGTYLLTFTASNGIAPDATQTVTLTVVQTPAITSGNAMTFTVGAAAAFTITTTGFPNPALSVIGTLPTGLTFDLLTGRLSGTPATGTAGTYALTFTASNGVAPDATQAFTLTVNAEPISGPTPEPYAVGSGRGRVANVRFLAPDGTDRFPAVQPYGGDYSGGARVASGDVNGDGVPEVIVGNGPGMAGLVRVLDGKTGTPLFEFTPFEPTFTGGLYVTTGDLNKDGAAEIVVTADRGGGARVVVIDGRTHGVLADFFGIDDPAFRGGASAAVGDVNGDGIPDLLVGAGTGGGPRVAVFDGATLDGRPVPTRLVSDFFVFEPDSRMGVHLACGDLNGDGKVDVIAAPGVGGGPRVVVLSGAGLGADAPVLANFFTTNPETRGGVHVSAHDVNGDGRPELLTGSGDGTGGRISMYTPAGVIGVPAPTEAWGLDPFGDFTGGVFVG